MLLKLAAALIVVGCAAPPVFAQSSMAERDTVLAVVQHLLDAMSRRDANAARALITPGGRFVATLGDGTRSAPRVQGDTAFLANLETGKEKLLERIWDPVVQLQGPLATVWAPYDFHVNGKRTHCGIDSFTLLRTAMVWRVSEITYTVQPTGCPDSPLGPPK
jgi:hypothetical protein